MADQASSGNYKSGTQFNKSSNSSSEQQKCTTSIPENVDAVYFSKEVLEMYNERGDDLYRPPWYRIALFGENPTLQRFRCEERVVKCFEEFPVAKLMIEALKSKGCPVDYCRNFACEWCSSAVSGGFDIQRNQVVVCMNRTNLGSTCGSLIHEMLHMYDYCRAKLDFTNDEHIACTEIRAANLFHCSITSGVLQGSVSIFDIKKAHRTCVKSKAAASLQYAKGISAEEALEVVNRVFFKCYNDLEPIGRRFRFNAPHLHQWAYRERYRYGYV